VRAVIVDDMAETLERALQVLLQHEAGMVGADRDSHAGRLYYGGSIDLWSPMSASGFRL